MNDFKVGDLVWIKVVGKYRKGRVVSLNNPKPYEKLDLEGYIRVKVTEKPIHPGEWTNYSGETFSCLPKNLLPREVDRDIPMLTVSKMTHETTLDDCDTPLMVTAWLVINVCRRDHGKPWCDNLDSVKGVASYLGTNDLSYLGLFQGDKRLIDMVALNTEKLYQAMED